MPPPLQNDANPEAGSPASAPSPGKSQQEDFKERLEKARKANHPSSEEESAAQAQVTALGMGFRIAAELLAAFLVAGVIGLLIDRVFNTTPWGMLIGLLLGFVTGIQNVIRATKNSNDLDKNKVDISETLPHDGTDADD